VVFEVARLTAPSLATGAILRIDPPVLPVREAFPQPASRAQARTRTMAGDRRTAADMA
jgi:hypothetical protein